MCEPVTLTALAIGGLTAAQNVSSYIGARHQADQQNEYYRENAAEASDAARLQFQDLSLSEAEQQMLASQKTQEITRQANAARSTAAVAASEAGVTGHSVDAVMNDLALQESTSIARVDLNDALAVDQLQREKEGVINQARSRINSVPQARRPSLIPLILGVGSGVLQGVTYYNDRTRRPNPSGVPTINTGVH